MIHPARPMLLLAVGTVGACVDAHGYFDDYKDRVPDAEPAVDIDGGIVSTLPDVDGDF
jgi:hypothetical protein